MNILVTGGCGFIGSHLVRQLIRDHSHRVVNIDHLGYAASLANVSDVQEDPRYQFIQADIRDAQAIQRILVNAKIEAIINCAAETHVDRSILDPTAFASTDVQGTVTLLECARQVKVTRFVQVSTDEVYGSLASGAATEEFPLHPSSPYSASKAGGELLALSYAQTYGLPVMVTRGSNTYGPNQYPEKLIPLALTNLLDNQPVPLYGDGQARRDWLFVQDHCRGIIHVLHHGLSGQVYNLGGGNERTNQDIVTLLLKYTDRAESLVRLVADRPGHDRRYAINCAKAHELGWRPMTPFEKGLQDTVDWYRHARAWWAPIKSGAFQAYYQEQYAARLAENPGAHSSLGKGAPSC